MCENVFDATDDARDIRLGQSPTLGDVEVGAIFAPILSGHQDLVFDRQLRRSARFDAGLGQMCGEDLNHLLESMRFDSTISLKFDGSQLLYLFVAHQDSSF